MTTDQVEPVWMKIFNRTAELEFALWARDEAPKVYEKIKSNLPPEYQDKARIGTLYAHSETGHASLEIYTFDNRGYGSCQVLSDKLEVDVFDLSGKNIYSGSYREFEPSLVSGDLKLFFGLKSGYAVYP